jgi:hypothetical protein
VPIAMYLFYAMDNANSVIKEGGRGRIKDEDKGLRGWIRVTNTSVSHAELLRRFL